MKISDKQLEDFIRRAAKHAKNMTQPKQPKPVAISVQ